MKTNNSTIRKLIAVVAIYCFSANTTFAQLAGTYTIGTNPTDSFASFTEAVDTLVSQGVSGPVIFDVQSGFYSEQITIPAITGASATNTITFQSLAQDSSLVTLIFSSTATSNNFVVKLDGADYFVFRKMTLVNGGSNYSRCFHLLNGANFNIIENCLITGANVNSTLTNYALIYGAATQDQNNIIRNSLFVDGSYGVYLRGVSNITLSAGNQVNNNQFVNQSGSVIFLENQDAPVANGNTIDASGFGSVDGIYLYECDNALQIVGNRISGIAINYGINLWYCSSSFVQKGLIANNFIIPEYNGTVYGGIQLYSCTYQNIYHNSVLIPETNTSAISSAFRVTIGGSNLDVRNNIFANLGAGYAYDADFAAAINTSNYNNLFTLGNFIGNWGGADAEDLTAWKTLSGKDANSLSVNPVFFSSTDLHTTTFRLDNTGTPLTSVTTDIDGELRSGSTPDIGADEFTGAGAPLCGNYTIGGGTPDFTTFIAAVDSLNEVGVSCPVTFNVRDGSYTEQFSIWPVSGSSSSSRVTFQSESGDSSMVILDFNSGANNNWVAHLQSADYITFRKMTLTAINLSYNRVFVFTGNTRSDSIANCVIVASGTATPLVQASDQYFNDIVIAFNIFSNGSDGVRLNGNDAQHSTGIQLLSNDFFGQLYKGIYLEDCDAPKITGNTINSIGGWNYYSIYLNDCDNALEISKNIIAVQDGYGGIYLTYCNATGIFKGLVSNNFIEIGGTTTAEGIYLGYSDYQRIFYNSVRITSTSASGGRAFYTEWSCTNLETKNNIFSNFGGGYAAYVLQAGNFASSNYNNLFTLGTNLGYWVSGATTDLSAWQSASGLDANSVSVNPVFVSPTDLHAQGSFIDGKGIPVSVTTDIDGQPRDPAIPDIGADEFTSTLTPLCGTYTIGGVSPDYSTFTAAVNGLNLRGISCPVVFNVRNGNYNEQIELLPVNGATASDSIIFQSESGDSTGVILTFNAPSIKDYVILLSNADYITFRKMTIAPIAISNEGNAITINGNVRNLNILNNIISGNAGSWEYLVRSDGDFTQNIRILNNVFSETNRGVSMIGPASPKPTGTVVSGNIFAGQDDYGIWLQYQDAPVVSSNTINLTGGSWYWGIALDYCDNALRVTENKINVSTYYGGISITNCNSTSVTIGLIANNFIWVGGSVSTARGIYLQNSAYQDVIYNNVNITNTYNQSRTFWSVSGNNQRVLNNIFSNTGGGWSYYIDIAGAISESDYNDLYATGVNLAYWDVANVTTLAALQAASGMDVNSISVNPQFYSTTNLHVLQAQLMGNATPYSAVTKDIDGQQRDPVTPDIGADEFFCQPPAFNVSVTEPCLGDSTTFTDMTTGVEPNSTFSWDFTSDGVVDYTSFTPNQTIKHLYPSAGAYTVRLIISQIAGCVDTLTFPAIVNTFPIVSFNKTGVYCDSANGTATVNVSGGQSPYTYLWSTGSSAQTITGLNLGLYTVTVNDANNCAVIDTVKISESMSVTVAAISPATCGNADGIAAVTGVSGGYPPYNYVWSNGDTTDTDSTLTAGVNYVTVIDTNGCVAFGTVTISDAGNAPDIAPTFPINNACYGDENGSININVAFGTPPYTYLWSNGSTTKDIDSLSAGIYEVTVTDAAGCIATRSYTILTPDILTVSVIATGAGCNLSDGSAFVVVSGGTTPYAYSWSSGGTNEVETGLPAGIYTVTVTDANGCSKIKPVLINNIGGPVITVVSKTDVDCNNPSDGAIDISVTGGAPSYTYSWSTGDTIQDINNLDTGTYNVTVTDANGCIAAASIEIKDKIPAVQPICVVTVDTATGYNLIVWDKTLSSNIAYFNIYREGTQSGIYFLVGSRPFDSLSTFLDTFASPQVKSWRYKMTAVDSCGKESDKQLSPIHKTIHLTMNLGLGDDVNLLWDHYQGFTYFSYTVYRGTTADSLVPFKFLSANELSYTDTAAPLSPNLFYMIAAELSSVCTATKKAENYNSSKSNTATSVSGGPSPAPVADFTANTTSIAVGGSVNFTDLSVNSPTSWAWTFAGGTPGSSNLQDPSNIVYNTPGSYDATLIATNVNGSDTMTKVSYITVTSTGAPPVANFLGCTTINIGNSVSFLDQSQNSPTSWVWSFENGNPAFSTDQNPTGIVYNTSGTFYVQLIVTNANGSDTLITQSCINVNPVGINENTPEGALMIYPNPGRGVFTVEIYDLRSAPASANATAGKIYDLSIYDVLGREIQKSKIKNQKSEINLSGQPAGIYHLQVITGSGVVNRRVVIQ